MGKMLPVAQPTWLCCLPLQLPGSWNSGEAPALPGGAIRRAQCPMARQGFTPGRPFGVWAQLRWSGRDQGMCRDDPKVVAGKNREWWDFKLRALSEGI